MQVKLCQFKNSRLLYIESIELPTYWVQNLNYIDEHISNSRDLEFASDNYILYFFKHSDGDTPTDFECYVGREVIGQYQDEDENQLLKCKDFNALTGFEIELEKLLEAQDLELHSLTVEQLYKTISRFAKQEGIPLGDKLFTRIVISQDFKNWNLQYLTLETSKSKIGACHLQ